MGTLLMPFGRSRSAGTFVLWEVATRRCQLRAATVNILLSIAHF